ncbi:jg15892 [Pararge aegeria aegeria]|uniref:Jg15892 protein n=1 Tax=Pararge aegeria aegeria TaxID=348720 RepID=A0A8S4SHI1_9NEOP|nr:jg15892 [Pararge aegeria aegeria]
MPSNIISLQVRGSAYPMHITYCAVHRRGRGRAAGGGGGRRVCARAASYAARSSEPQLCTIYTTEILNTISNLQVKKDDNRTCPIKKGIQYYSDNKTENLPATYKRIVKHH